MALTRDFKETVRDRVQRDPAFRKALLTEAIEAFLSGDVETGKSVLRDCINATVGFNEVAITLKRSPKSIMRMLGPNGNPQAQNLFEIIAFLQREEGVQLKVKLAKAS
jgi:DNA-binding phage protein